MILNKKILEQKYPDFITRDTFRFDDMGITTISLDTFENVPMLKHITLNENKIMILKLGLFDNVPLLETLYVRNNRITILEPGLFNNNLMLKQLVFPNNEIMILEHGLFNNLPNIVLIKLTDNLITKIEYGVLNNIPTLQHLLLDFNQISYIEPGAFNNFPILQNLVLDNNEIIKIFPGTFDVSLNKHVDIDLNYNLLTSDENIPKIPDIEIVKLHKNFIPNISEYSANIKMIELLQTFLNKDKQNIIGNVSIHDVIYNLETLQKIKRIIDINNLSLETFFEKKSKELDILIGNHSMKNYRLMYKMAKKITAILHCIDEVSTQENLESLLLLSITELKKLYESELLKKYNNKYIKNILDKNINKFVEYDEEDLYSGGGNFYKQKYLKYKQKYLLLKK